LSAAAPAPALTRFADVRPAAVASCRTPGEVAEALAHARRSGLAVAARGGGHCFAGRSSTEGLLVDLGPMSDVRLSDGVATVGAGTKLGLLYDTLADQGRTIAGGCGPTVGIAGLALGGGIGILGRRYGLTSDQVVAAEVVLADGRAVRCDGEHEADLFWALRGAGGLRCGVVTSLELTTRPAEGATSFEVSWPAPAAAAVIDAWQRWAPDAPDDAAPSLLVTAAADPTVPLRVRVFGAMLGTESDARDTLAALVAAVGSDPATATFEHLPYRQTKRFLAEHDAGSTAKPDPGYLFAKSEFFRSPLPAQTAAALVEHLVDDRVPGEARELDFTPWGGAYNRLRSDATAFPHRAERFLLKHEVVIDAGPAEPRAREWLRRSWAISHPYGTGGAYSNFPDADLDPWDRAYHGENLERLMRAKAEYDPDGAFA
jgi:FAD/FMN-containing dehydrogenase